MSLIQERESVRAGAAPPKGRAEKKARGRPKRAEAGSRLHISIPESLTKRLLEIQRDIHATSLTEVIKNALALYAAAVEEHKNGGHVYFKRKNDGVERQLTLFI